MFRLDREPPPPPPPAGLLECDDDEDEDWAGGAGAWGKLGMVVVKAPEGGGAVEDEVLDEDIAALDSIIGDDTKGEAFDLVPS